MAKGPSEKDYAPSAAETVNAEIAQNEWTRFKTKYRPVLKLRGETSQTDAVKTNLRGRANADVAQALTRPNLAVVENPTAAGDMAEARMGQLAVADKVALERKNTTGANVLAKASQQKGQAQEGLALASRLSTSAALERARAKQEVAQAKINAAVQIGSAFTSQAAENYSQTKDIWTPGRLNNEATTKNNGVPVYDKVTDIAGRWELGTKRFAR